MSEKIQSQYWELYYGISIEDLRDKEYRLREDIFDIIKETQNTIHRIRCNEHELEVVENKILAIEKHDRYWQGESVGSISSLGRGSMSLSKSERFSLFSLPGKTSRNKVDHTNYCFIDQYYYQQKEIIKKLQMEFTTLDQQFAKYDDATSELAMVVRILRKREQHDVQ